MAFRLNVLSSVVSGMCGLLIFYFSDSMSAATSGLVLNYAADFCSYITAAITSGATMEMSMNAVERVGEYCALPQEGENPAEPPEGRKAMPLLPAPVEPPSNWPSKGEITATQLSLRYESSPRPVIEGISFTIPGCSSVGVVGRTGAGKSTISLALLRMIEACDGALAIGELGRVGVRRCVIGERCE